MHLFSAQNNIFEDKPCRSYLCHQPALVLFDVFPKRGWHGQCHSSWLGELGQRCYTDVYDLSAVQSNGEFWHASKHCLAGCHDRSCCPFPDLRSHHETLVLGHTRGQALRCVCDWLDPETIFVGLCRGAERHPHHCDDFSIQCMIRHRTRYEQPTCHPFQDLFPNGCGRCISLGRSFWPHEPVC